MTTIIRLRVNMNRLKNFRWNLGIPSLLPEWKAIFSPTYFGADLAAGITVAFVAIPLSLAIALASGMSPASGLVTAIIAGIVCALFGGTPLAVSGPAAAMSVLIANNVEKFGVKGLVFMGLIAGVLQLLSGISGLGKFSRYVPLPVVAGFTAGIGVIIIIGQLPRAFGLEPPTESHTFDVIMHVKDYFYDINLVSLSIVILTIGIIRGLPYIFPKVPGILPAVLIATLVVYFFHLPVQLIGEIPRSLPAPQLPSLPNFSFNELLLGALAIYLLASLETLLSSSSIDKLTGDKKHDPNQELIGQGLGNIAVSLFGGIPVTGVIARSATNVRAGAKTRRASIIHSIIILLTVVSIAPLISQIPVAALAGVLFSVAFSMINYKESYSLWVTSRSEAFIYAVTFLTIIFVDLIAGVQAGVMAAAIIVLWKAARTKLQISATSKDNMIRLSLGGPLTFLSTGEMEELAKHLEGAKPNQTVILDLTSVTNLDTSGANAIIDLFNQCKERQIAFYIKGLPRKFEPLFGVWGGQAILNDYYLISENELSKVDANAAPNSYYGRLVHGVHRFYAQNRDNDSRLLDFIAKTQDPHTLFISCSDSRIVPTLITSAEPGELFTIRNVGNFIPNYEDAELCSEGAAVEFSLNSLNITDVVVCGHTNCGAIRACKGGNYHLLPPKLKGWIELMSKTLTFDEDAKVDEIARQNVINQLKTLKQYPIVKKRLEEKTLKLHAWFFDFEENLVYEWNKKTKEFTSIEDPVFTN